jgi:hypothetical protein
VRGHFALGQHAVERLNETNLNLNEMFISQSLENQQALKQQQAQATLPSPQVIFSPNQEPLIDNKPPQNIAFASNQIDHQHQIVNPSHGAAYGHQAIPLHRNQEKQVLYQNAPQTPLFYQYTQQNVPQINYYYQQKPQEVIYHQQPIASMSDLQPTAPHQQLFNEVQQFSENNESHDGSLSELPQATVSQEIVSSEIIPSRGGVKGKLLEVQPTAPNEVATDNQKYAKHESDTQVLSEQSNFNTPIIVGEQQKITFGSANETVIVQQKQGPVVFSETYQPQKQINLQILSNSKGKFEEQYLREVTPTSTPLITQHVNGHTNVQYHVKDIHNPEEPPTIKSDAPSRQFLKNFNNFRKLEKSTIQKSTVAVSYSTTTLRTVPKGDEVSPTPISNNFLAPVHAGIRLTNAKLDDCVDGHNVKPTVIELNKTVSIKNFLVKEQSQKTPVYGDKIFVSTTPVVPVVTQPFYLKEEVQNPVEKTVIVQSPPKIISRPVYIQSQPQTKVVQHQVIVEKPVIKEVQVQVPVEKTVYVKSNPEIIDRPVYIQSPPETKIVKEQVIVEKPVIKEVHVPVEKTVYVKSKPEIIDRPVYIQTPPETKIVEKEVIIEKPVIKEVQVPVEKTVFVKSPPETIEKPVYIEKIVDRPVEKIVEKIVDRPYPVEKYIDRPYPVPYAVPVQYEKHILSKPDFHVIAKSAPHKGKLFDFEGLFGFLSKKKEVKHIYVPASQQHQLKQLNQHQLIHSSLTTIDAVNESPVLDYTKYATSHLNPIKPIYGVPKSPLEQVKGEYSYSNPYAGETNLFKGVIHK